METCMEMCMEVSKELGVAFVYRHLRGDLHRSLDRDVYVVLYVNLHGHASRIRMELRREIDSYGVFLWEPTRMYVERCVCCFVMEM